MALCLLYGSVLTTLWDHWEDHCLDDTDICRQSNVSAFQHIVYICHHFPAKKQSPSDLMAAVTIHSDFEAHKEEICHYFHLFPSYLPCSNGVRGEGNGNPLQYSCLENPMDGGAWWAAVHGVTKSQTRLSDFTFTFHFNALKKAMATHSSVLAWRMPGMGEPRGLMSMGSYRFRHDRSDLALSAYVFQ